MGNKDALVLQVSRDRQKIKASVRPKENSTGETLLPYEEHDVAWEEVERGCHEILSLMNRANNRGRVGPEVLNGLKKSGHVLFDLLLPSRIRQILDSTTAKILILHLDDGLVHIPWELLFNGEEFLCRKFAIGRIVSTRQAVNHFPRHPPTPPIKVLVIADPQGNLEASYREGIEIRDFLDQKRELFQVDLKSQPVDVSYLKKNLRDYDFVHYAGHAEYAPDNPSESSWFLSDRKLRAKEIMAMAGLRSLPSLVFANACQSGQTEDWQIQTDYESQIFGLANAFLLSGVQHYIGTFWKILDQPSLQFAKIFYSALSEEQTIGEAIRTARMDLIHRYGEETIVWASYMLYGDPTISFVISEQTLKSRDALGQEWPIRRKSQSMFGLPSRPAIFLYPVLGLFLLALASLGFLHLYPTTLHIGNLFSSYSSLSTSTIHSGSQTSNFIPLSLTMNIIGQRKESDGTYTEVFVREGSILRSRDNFQVHLQTNRPSHLYILLHDSQGKVTQLFPHPKIDQPGFVQPSRRIVVPGENLWFWLDENTGTETLYVLASEKPLSAISNLLSKMEAASGDEKERISGDIRDKIKFVQRGVGGISKGITASYTLSDGQLIDKVTEVVSGSGAVVRAVSFEHR